MRIRIARLMMSMLHSMGEHFNNSSSASYRLLSSNVFNNNTHSSSKAGCCHRLSLYRSLFSQHVPPLTCLFLTCLLISTPTTDWVKSYTLTTILFVMFFFSLIHFLETFLTFAPNIPERSRFLVEMPQPTQFPNWRVVRLTTPSLGSGANVVLKSFLLLQEEPVKRANAPTILCIHGNAGNIGHRLPMAKILYDVCGANVFLLEYRGYGYSTGQPNEIGFYADAKAALDYLASGADGDINGRNLFVFGRSMGGAIAVGLCTRSGVSRHVRGVILENTFTSIAGMGQTIISNILGPFGSRCLPTGLIHNRFNSLKKLKECSLDEDLKFLFISGSKDDVVPPHMMNLLAQAWAMNKGKIDAPEDSWHFEDPQAFLNGGSEGIVRFAGGNHGTTWMCEGFNDVIRRFISLHQSPIGVTN